jgi:hypothetical protein
MDAVCFVATRSNRNDFFPALLRALAGFANKLLKNDAASCIPQYDAAAAVRGQQ